LLPDQKRQSLLAAVAAAAATAALHLAGCAFMLARSRCNRLLSPVLLPWLLLLLILQRRTCQDEQAGLLKLLLDLVGEGTRGVAASQRLGANVLRKLEHLQTQKKGQKMQKG
jgi:hypothetical protein